jgi:hypothetical protein
MNQEHTRATGGTECRPTRSLWTGRYGISVHPDGLLRLAFLSAYPKIVTGTTGRPARRAASPPPQQWRLAGQASARPVNARITMIR